jgi:hypothetical protein
VNLTVTGLCQAEITSDMINTTIWLVCVDLCDQNTSVPHAALPPTTTSWLPIWCRYSEVSVSIWTWELVDAADVWMSQIFFWNIKETKLVKFDIVIIHHERLNEQANTSNDFCFSSIICVCSNQISSISLPRSTISRRLLESWWSQNLQLLLNSNCEVKRHYWWRHFLLVSDESILMVLNYHDYLQQTSSPLRLSWKFRIELE